METLIQIIWWIGLLGALLATLAILKEVTLVVAALQDIYELAERTRIAAEQIADNVGAVSQMGMLEPPAEKVRDVAQQLASEAAAVEEAFAELLPGRRSA